MIAIFMGSAITLGVAFIIGYPIFKNMIGGGETTWAATAALYASWVGGSAPRIAAAFAAPTAAAWR